MAQEQRISEGYDLFVTNETSAQEENFTAFKYIDDDDSLEIKIEALTLPVGLFDVSSSRVSENEANSSDPERKLLQCSQDNLADNDSKMNSTTVSLQHSKHEIVQDNSTDPVPPTELDSITSTNNPQISYEKDDKGPGWCYIKGCALYGRKFRRLNTHLTGAHGMDISKHSSKYLSRKRKSLRYDNFLATKAYQRKQKSTENDGSQSFSDNEVNSTSADYFLRKHNNPANTSWKGSNTDAGLNVKKRDTARPNNKKRKRGRPAKRMEIGTNSFMNGDGSNEGVFQGTNALGKRRSVKPKDMHKDFALSRAEFYEKKPRRKPMKERCMIPQCTFFGKSYKFLDMHLKYFHSLSRQQYDRVYGSASHIVSKIDEVDEEAIKMLKENISADARKHKDKKEDMASQSFVVVSSKQANEPESPASNGSCSEYKGASVSSSSSNLVAFSNSDAGNSDLKIDYNLRSSRSGQSQGLPLMSIKPNKVSTDEVLIQCPFAFMGCSFKAKAMEISKHLETMANDHMNVMWENFMKTKAVANEPKSPTSITHFWIIDNFLHHVHMARSGDPISLYSEQFSTGKNGYCFYLCAYPNGFLDGLNSHVSIYLHLTPGSCDSALPWPFKQSFTIAVINQKSFDKDASEHIRQICQPDPENVFLDGEIFKRPIKHESNQGWGKTKFISHDDIFNGKFIKDNSLMIAVKMESFDLSDTLSI